ncbi:glycogen-binding domain-containing protein [Desulfonatronovibrio magnus]|uniref:glycogen-binding domain-containing protein n=1 Tax=Desulfonatronovibrio magnus TaxID=698827 RepID=UPI0009FE710F|nr:glycogen-binding domain-containing protein [Desulfonatronovibrio magnus]
MKKSHQNCKKLAAPNLTACGSILLQAFFAVLAVGCISVKHRTVDHPVEQTSYTVLFVYEGQADSICVTGDFNGWSSHDCCMDSHNERWEAECQLNSGKHIYAFFINGEKFIPDPQALIMEDDGFGGYNSAVIIP